MNLRTAAQQALRALEWNLPVLEDYGDKDQLDRQHKAITALHTALRTALAEPVQEPVAWMHEDELPSCYPYDLMFPYSKVNGVRLFPVFGPSPQRKPLTDEEIVDLWADVSIDYDDQINIIEMARAIERAHGIGGEA